MVWHSSAWEGPFGCQRRDGVFRGHSVGIGEEVQPLIVLWMVAIINEHPVDSDRTGHREGVAEIVHAIVAGVDQVRPDGYCRTPEFSGSCES